MKQKDFPLEPQEIHNNKTSLKEWEVPALEILDIEDDTESGLPGYEDSGNLS